MATDEDLIAQALATSDEENRWKTVIQLQQQPSLALVALCQELSESFHTNERELAAGILAQLGVKWLSAWNTQAMPILQHSPCRIAV